MNKKLAVLLVVPLLVSLGGAFAFSAFSGNSSVTINNTAGHLTWENRATLEKTNATNTPLTIMGPNGHMYKIGAGDHFHPSEWYGYGLGKQYYSTATSGREYVINVTNFAPGEYIQLGDVITNNGTVGFIVTTPSTLSIAAVSSSNSTYNANGSSIAATNIVQCTNFMSDLQTSTGWIYDVTEYSGFGVSLSPGGTAIMMIQIGLGNNSPNYYQGSDISLVINLNVVSDP